MPLPENLLKKVSRSFYLTLRILPRGMGEPIGIAYLIARAADTIADTRSIEPAHRRRMLFALRTAIDCPAEGMPDEFRKSIAAQALPHEKELMQALPSILYSMQSLDEGDRIAVRKVLETLVSGMEFDLDTFPDEHSGEIAALDSREALDRYTYLVAGCVGEFWTDMMFAHVPGIDGLDSTERTRLGIRFGKALQMTNVLRDCAQDLRIGRCYLPQAMLAPRGLTPRQLLDSASEKEVRPVIHSLLRDTLDHFRAAVQYTLAIPPRHRRLRLACLWPIVIGLETLLTHVHNLHWLEPGRASKITRMDVYRILIASLPRAGSNAAVRRWTDRLLQQIEARLSC